MWSLPAMRTIQWRPSAKRERYSHVLLDYGVNGAFEYISGHLRTKRLKVAVFTADPEGARREAAALGFGLIAKPASFETLKAWFDNPQPAAAEARGSTNDLAFRKTGLWTVDFPDRRHNPQGGGIA